MISLSNLERQVDEIWPDLMPDLEALIRNAEFIGGRTVKQFEHEFSLLVNSEFCVSCGNGTDALELILEALDVGPGDEVLVPALTYVATVEAVLRRGATAVLVDVDDNLVMDLERAVSAVTPKCVAAISVHLHGFPANVPKLIEVIPDRVRVIEDAAQAHGTELLGKPVGGFGVAGAFSFFPSKSLGAWGDAGAVVTHSKEVASAVKLLANHGRINKDTHVTVGRNSRLDAIQALVLLHKTRYLSAWRARRQEVAERYIEALLKVEWLELPRVPQDGVHGWHQFAIGVEDREGFRRHLAVNGIESGVHYPYALSDLPFDGLRISSGTEIARKASRRLVSLPMSPHLTEDEVDQVVEAVLSFQPGGSFNLLSAARR